jgi:hypothetical protein
MTTKPDATKSRSSKLDKDAGKVNDLTWGDLRTGRKVSRIERFG